MALKANETLSTAKDITSQAPTGFNMNPAELCELIVVEEEKLFNACWGYDAYLDLIGDKVDYSAVNEYQNQTYSVDALVTYEGNVYKCILQTTGSQNPKNKKYWERAPKFGTAEYEFAWYRYLRTIIAWFVIRRDAMPQTIKFGEKGLQKRSGQHSEAASLEEIRAVMEILQMMGTDHVANFESYMKRNPSKFGNFKSVTCDESCAANAKGMYGFNL